MSGTSADGIDAALLHVRGSGMSTRFRLRGFTTVPYPRGLREFLFENSDPETARLHDVARLNILLGELFAQAARRVVWLGGKRMADVDLIGSHGQTIAHDPHLVRMFGKRIRATLQIGDPSVIAKRTGVVTVGDFRVADVAVGGSGAPLVPYVDYLLFRSRNKNRALLNIGGIANITVLPKNCMLNDVIAFDTGPGNMLIDALMRRLYKLPFDRDGRAAARGKLIPRLLSWLMSHPYLAKHPPKSTGREMFGETFAEKILHQLSRMARRVIKEDVVATVSMFTALSVYDAYLRYIRPRGKLDELFICGGGGRNRYLVNLLQNLFDGVRVDVVDALGMNADAKEAICFALLANETIAGNPGNVPSATGAKRTTVLGKICLP